MVLKIRVALFILSLIVFGSSANAQTTNIRSAQLDVLQDTLPKHYLGINLTSIASWIPGLVMSYEYRYTANQSLFVEGGYLFPGWLQRHGYRLKTGVRFNLKDDDFYVVPSVQYRTTWRDLSRFVDVGSFSRLTDYRNILKAYTIAVGLGVKLPIDVNPIVEIEGNIGGTYRRVYNRGIPTDVFSFGRLGESFTTDDLYLPHLTLALRLMFGT